jgi:hypothetical protein
LFFKISKYDAELNAFEDRLFEFNKSFPPSYPFSEEVNEVNSYTKSRCPSWCDRILVNKLFKNEAKLESINYDMIGRDSCMGDHKPIYLTFTIECDDESGFKDQNNNNRVLNRHNSMKQHVVNQNLVSYNNNINNATIINRQIIQPFEYLTQNYLLINDCLFDLNQPFKTTNLHNYAKFKNFNSLILGVYKNSETMMATMNLNQIENNFNDDNYLKNFFKNDLNANLLFYKRLLTKFKQDKLSHLTLEITIQDLVESVKISNWRESLFLNKKNMNQEQPKENNGFNKLEGIFTFEFFLFINKKKILIVLRKANYNC